jgi:predicted nuclease with RNAse H fold
VRPACGIDLSLRRGLDLAVLGDDLCVEALIHAAGVEEAVAWLAAQAPQAIVGIDAPQGARQGLLGDERARPGIVPPPPAGRYLHHRLCDYHLARRGINLYLTPAPGEPVPGWMAVGFALFASLQAHGYRRPAHAGDRGATLLEVYPHAIFTCLLGAVPPPKSTPEGLATCRSLLERAGVRDLPAALSHDQLDAIAAALGARRFAQGGGCAVGDAAEGYMILPVPEEALPERFRRYSIEKLLP